MVASGPCRWYRRRSRSAFLGLKWAAAAQGPLQHVKEQTSAAWKDASREC